MNTCRSLNSEEAKSTTWLHPVSGEAVITGHRKTPGKVSSFSVSVSHVRRDVLPVHMSPNRYFTHGRGDIRAVFVTREWASGAR